jgi:2,3-bisphosphoglycerate-independent phosphoglycerate mutase
MVGHTGNLAATECSMEALDLQIARILKVVDKMHGVAMLTADHGNADEMFETDKKGMPKVDKNGKMKAKTSHTLNPVPFIIYDNFYSDKYIVKADEGKFGLSNVAATTANFLGYDKPDKWDESIVEMK